MIDSKQKHIAIVTTSIRLPKDVADWLRKEARRTGASLNSEMVRAIRGRMERGPRACAAS